MQTPKREVFLWVEIKDLLKTLTLIYKNKESTTGIIDVWEELKYTQLNRELQLMELELFN